MKRFLVLSLLIGGAAACSDGPNKSTNNTDDDVDASSIDSGSDVGTPDMAATDLGGDSGEDMGTEPDVEENAAPIAADVNITPSQPAVPGERLTCNYTFDDADGDADMSQIEWTVNGESASTGPSFTRYGTGDEVRCHVTPFDGMLEGDVVSSEPVFGPPGAMISVATEHTCIATAAGAVRCWGSNEYGRLGALTPTDSDAFVAPTTPAGLSSDVTQVAAGELGSCAIQAGALKCWGSGASGLLGPTVSDVTVTPTEVLSDGVSQVAVKYHACAIQNGGLMCWGGNSNGELGNPVGVEPGGVNATPTLVQGLTSNVTKVAVGRDHTCAIRDGAVVCFGLNRDGQLGRVDNLGVFAPNPTPATVVGLESGVTDIVAGDDFNCAIHNGVVKCWGTGTSRVLGRSVGEYDGTPTAVPGVSGEIDLLAAGGYNVCIVQDGAQSCWGSNVSGQLLGAQGTSSASPIEVRTPTVSAMAAARGFICAERNGELACWGNNRTGQLGHNMGVGTDEPQAPRNIMY